MNRVRTRFLVSAGLLLLLLAGPASGQGPGPGPQAERPWMGIYDPRTVETVSGIVLSVTPPHPQADLPELVYLTLKTEREKLTVFLGPSVFITKVPVKVENLDRIEVTGSRVNLEGRPILIAAEIKKGNQVTKLREKNGTPVWSHWGLK